MKANHILQSTILKEFKNKTLLNSLFLALFLIAYSFYLCIHTEFFYNILKYIFLFYYIFVTFMSIKKYGFFSVYSLFLSLSTFFIYDSIFFDLINYPKFEEFTVTYFPAKHFFKMDTGVTFLFYSTIFLFILDISFFYFYKKKYFFSEKEYMYLDLKNIGTLSFYIMLVTYPIIFYRLLKVALFVLSKGYVYCILNGVEDAIPSWTNGISGIFLIAFYAIIITAPSKKIFLVSIFLYGTNCFVKGLAGNRGAFLYDLFALIVLYLSLYKSKKVSLVKVLFLISASFLFSFIIGETRDNDKENKSIEIKENFLLNFLATQTTSRTVPFIIIENDIPYHNYPFIFSPFLNSVTDNTDDNDNRMMKIKHNNSIDYLTSYTISPYRTLNGNGLGGAVIGEFIDCGGYLGVILWTIVLALIISFLDDLKTLDKFLRPLAYILLVNMMHNPRGYFFAFIVELKYWIISILLIFVLSIFNKYARKFRG